MSRHKKRHKKVTICYFIPHAPYATYGMPLSTFSFMWIHILFSKGKIRFFSRTRYRKKKSLLLYILWDHWLLVNPKIDPIVYGYKNYSHDPPPPTYYRCSIFLCYVINHLCSFAVVSCLYQTERNNFEVVVQVIKLTNTCIGRGFFALTSQLIIFSQQ